MIELLVVIYVVTFACLVDALRRSAGVWAEADKNKSYWVMTLVISLVAVLPAFVIVPAYVIGVLPRFSGASKPAAHDPFRK